MKPSTVEVMLSSLEKDCWLEAMEKEMSSVQENDVWELVDLPGNWLNIERSYYKLTLTL